MLISLNKIKEYVKIEIPTEELIRLIGSRLVEVEGSTDLAPKYQGIKIVKVTSCEPIPDTHLHLCQVDAGESEPVQVVCGAPNVHAGMLTAWIMPGSIVPETYGGENFRLSVRKLRGYESHGMLAAADELALGNDHEGIIEIDPQMSIPGPMGAARPVQPGDDFATAFDLNDIILDIENKSLTHRPDCFGLIGFAREVAGILGERFEKPGHKIEKPISASDGVMRFRPDLRMSKSQPSGKSCDFDNEQVPPSEADLAIEIANPALCPRYSCAVLDCSKLLERGKYFTRQDAFLAKSGMHPISPIVDLTNVLMLETGQPLHAFDYDKFVKVGGASEPKILVRLAKPGEKLQLLDGKTIECVDTDILIASNDIPVALAGAMGGASTEIDASSRQIILESATFSLYNLRKTQMAHGIFSEAITRFTKGQPASQTLPVLQEAIRRLATTPLAVTDCYPAPAAPIVVKITTQEINGLLGTDYDTTVITKTLENVGFEVSATNSAKSAASLEITAPAWRTDIHIKEDIIEEVGRLLGFDNIPTALPMKPFSGTSTEPMWRLKSQIRGILSDKLGAHELLTYSFISGDLLQKVGESPAKSYKITNSISPELQYFRQTITPSLLDKVYQNLKSGHSDFTIYEINQVADKSEALDADGVPLTHTRLGIVTFGDFYEIKCLATALARNLRISAPITPAKAGEALPAYFEPLHCVASQLGHFGEIKKSVLRKFKLEDYQISALEWNLDAALALPQSPIALPRLAFSKFPIVARDLTFRTPAAVTYAQLADTLTAALMAEDIIYEITPISIYEPESGTSSRNISFHLDFASQSQTLASSQISDIIERVTSRVAALGAETV